MALATKQPRTNSSRARASSAEPAAVPLKIRKSGLRLYGPRPSLDGLSVSALLAGFALVTLAIVAGGGALGSFFNPAALLIVLGGTACVALISFSWQDLGATLRLMRQALGERRVSEKAVAVHMLQLSEVARDQGPLALQELLGPMKAEPFLQTSVQLMCDGMPPDEIDAIMEADLAASAERYERAAQLFRRAADVAPSMGLIGTLIGLVHMLSQLSDPAAIGPGMAVALLTTLYGAVLGTMLLGPLAIKLERKADAELAIKTLYVTGIGAIARRYNPRRLEVMLNAVLPPASKLRYFD